MKALLSCSNPDEASILTLILQQIGFSVRPLHDIEQNLEELSQLSLQFILYILPESLVSNGPPLSIMPIKQLCNLLKVPIMVICPNLSEELHVNLLEAGVDTILAKPYSIRVLQAQVRNILRRNAGLPYFSIPILSHGGMTLDPTRRIVYIQGLAAQHLTQLEFRLLYTLMTHIGQIMPTVNIVEHVWGYSGSSSRDLVRGLIQRLRSKVEPNPSQPCYILTESGIGYYFKRNYEELEVELPQNL